ncbi:zinc finger protein ZPR1-like protein [Euroglyphus maynei]|uniref:Zinc finger protein ZPR1-like protein n=1 Tax=Euroglyphus maynei TaxID=6958 RepID=A0A1Y3B1K7_EURMA|nr:zinc finger protein ZPR1-like protein [Euroglyphus maynei]
MSETALFADLSKVADDPSDDMTEIENCYCVNCGKDGTTRMLLTDIPFFRQVVVMSFECLHCNFRNNELQPAAKIAEKGVRYELTVADAKDLSRQLIKTEWARVKIPELDFEIKQQNGMITTVEGILERAITGLEYSLKHNEQIADDQRKAMVDFIERMRRLKDASEQFTLIIEDISGNSFIENYLAPQPDPQLKVTNFIRTIDEDKLLGIYETEQNENSSSDLKDEVLQFPTNCPNCNAPCFTNMKLTEIPHFKEVIIMATNCEICGNRTNEVKSGAGIEPRGVRITINIRNEDDLKKEVVRSDTCNISIPELSLTLNSSGSGRYTTIQGLGLNMIDDLRRTNPFIDGDSSREEIREKIERLNHRLTDMIGLTIILDDPCGNSFVEQADLVEHYERSWQQNEELGLNDMNAN